MYWQIPETNVRLLGTMHLLPAKNSGLPPWVTQAYEWADVVVLESEAHTILPFLSVSASNGLQEKISPETWTTLETLWPKSGSLPALDAAAPWAVFLISSMLTVHTAEGVEPQFSRWAKDAEKPIHFLETAEAVASAFSSAPIDEICEALEVWASDLSEAQRGLDAMYRHWLLGDLPGVASVASRMPSFNYSGLKEAVLLRRNRQWVPEVCRHLRSSQKTLIAVGALHLTGSENVINCVGCDTVLIPP